MSRRLGAALVAVVGAAVAWGQTPDVRAHADLSLTLDSLADKRAILRLYNSLGRPSIASLNLTLETGYNVYIAERLQRLPNDSDGDIFDEVYIEDPGIWKVGKQYLPFGNGHMLHESITAARIDSNLIAEQFPVSIAVGDGGQGRQNGATIRIGRAYGISAAFGSNFGISGTSLGVVRRPENAPGKNGGWKRAFGADVAQRYGKVLLTGEAVAFDGGPEADTTVYDAEASFQADNYHSAGFGFSHASGDLRGTFLRMFGRIHCARNIDLEPLVRWRNGGIYDASVTMHIRL